MPFRSIIQIETDSAPARGAKLFAKSREHTTYPGIAPEPTTPMESGLLCREIYGTTGFSNFASNAKLAAGKHFSPVF